MASQRKPGKTKCLSISDRHFPLQLPFLPRRSSGITPGRRKKVAKNSRSGGFCDEFTSLRLVDSETIPKETFDKEKIRQGKIPRLRVGLWGGSRIPLAGSVLPGGRAVVLATEGTGSRSGRSEGKIGCRPVCNCARKKSATRNGSRQSLWIPCRAGLVGWPGQNLPRQNPNRQRG